VQQVLGHPHRDRRQLSDLTPSRFRRIDLLRAGELVRATLATLGPMLNDLVDLLGRNKPPVATLVPLLAAALPTRPLPTRPWRRRRRILRRRQRRVPRTPIQTTLKLRHPILKPLIRSHQPLIRGHQLIEPKQQPDS
jgi:hypothetical protein